MTGTVVIIVPEKLIVQLVRAQLEVCSVAEIKVSKETIGHVLKWQHRGCEERIFDPDVLCEDGDKTDYEKVAKDMWLTIATDMGNVVWRWDSAKKTWDFKVSPLPNNGTRNVDLDIDEELVGYGSLGR